MNVSGLPKEAVFLVDSQDTESIYRDFNVSRDDYDSFFVVVGEGEYLKVWGMSGKIQHSHKNVDLIHQAIPAWESPKQQTKRLESIDSHIAQRAEIIAASALDGLNHCHHKTSLEINGEISWTTGHIGQIKSEHTLNVIAETLKKLSDSRVLFSLVDDGDGWIAVKAALKKSHTAYKNTIKLHQIANGYYNYSCKVTGKSYKINRAHEFDWVFNVKKRPSAGWVITCIHSGEYVKKDSLNEVCNYIKAEQFCRDDCTFNRFDICEAHYCLEVDYNVSGVLQERPSNQRRKMSTEFQLSRMPFGACPNLCYDTLEENGKAIYNQLERLYGFADKNYKGCDVCYCMTTYTVSVNNAALCEYCYTEALHDYFGLET
jgi:hypothetical protein